MTRFQSLQKKKTFDGAILNFRKDGRTKISIFNGIFAGTPFMNHLYIAPIESKGSLYSLARDNKQGRKNQVKLTC